MSDSPVVDRVRALVTPILSDLGLGLYDLDFGGGLLKITVDRAGGVDLDTIALVTRLVNRELDHTDPVPGKYTLEVSSPGIERSLRRPEHFLSAIGDTVNVRLRDVTNDERRFQGTLVAADEDGITVRTESGERHVPYAHVDRARTVFEWGPPPKGGAAKPKTNATKASASTKKEVTAS